LLEGGLRQILSYAQKNPTIGFLTLDYAGGLKESCYFSPKGMMYLTAILKIGVLVLKCY